MRSRGRTEPERGGVPNRGTSVIRRCVVALGVISTIALPLATASIAAASPSGGSTLSALAPMTGTLPPANPPANIPQGSGNLVQATNEARADEGVAPLSFDGTAFNGLTVPEQVFVIENLERTGRGEQPVEAMTAQLDSYAQAGADAGRDPTHPPVLTGGGVVLQGGTVWAGGTASPLLVNYLWMYQDGWGGSAATTTNQDCNASLLNGCWEHRDIILTQYSSIYCLGSAPILVMGAAESNNVRGGSVAAVFLSTCGPAPTDAVFTWAQAQQELGITSSTGVSSGAARTAGVGSAAGAAGSNSTGGGPPTTVGMTPTPDGKGYWLVGSDGGIFSYGDATFYGSMGGQPLNRPIVGMASTPDGRGYWLVASDGGIFSFGDAVFYGSTGSLHLNAPIVGLTATADGRGYWFVAADGGVFSYGDATFYGSMGGQPLNRPIVGMASTPSGRGYWFVAADGGIFSYGDATFYGSMGGQHLNRPIVGMTSSFDGHGYRFVAADGGIFSYGDATFYGSMGGQPLNRPIVGMAATPGGAGYWLAASDGGIFSFGAAVFYGSNG